VVAILAEAGRVPPPANLGTPTHPTPCRVGAERQKGGIAGIAGTRNGTIRGGGLLNWGTGERVATSEAPVSALNPLKTPFRVPALGTERTEPEPPFFPRQRGATALPEGTTPVAVKGKGSVWD